MTSILPNNREIPQEIEGEVLHTTASVCPICLRRIDATLTQQNSEILLAKTCPEHGDFSTAIWRGTPDFGHWQRPKTAHRGGWRLTKPNKGCPYDCGLCTSHNQRTCTALIEITSRCNLHCPICFADAGGGLHLPLDKIETMLERVFQQTGGCNLQLSGGEPSLHPQLPEIIQLAAAKGFTFIQLNSNGLRLAEEPEFCLALKKAGLSSVFLQFDGLSDTIYTQLRGVPLLEKKKQAIANLAAVDIGIVLVPTLVSGINTDQLWDIIRFGLDRQPHVRGVHFQPVSYFGRYPHNFSPCHFTLPEVMTALEKQSGGILQTEHFQPPGCEHALCSFSARYLKEEDGSLCKIGNQTQKCDCAPKPALQGAIQSIAVTARQWKNPDAVKKEAIDDFDRFLQRAKQFSFSVSAMAFQDVWNLDLERLQGCCIHVATEGGKLIPFCSYNLTATDGHSLHRKGAA